jgi:hypothetical protein
MFIPDMSSPAWRRIGTALVVSVVLGYNVGTATSPAGVVTGAGAPLAPAETGVTAR